MKHYSHLNTAVTILTEYKGQQPFSIFIKEFFRADKKYGSKDRKQISHLCYCYFRLGKATGSLSTSEKVLAGLFLCSDQSNELLQAIKPGWNEHILLKPAEKWVLTGLDETPATVFPWVAHLSADMVYQSFCESFFIQPDLFLRIRPGFEKRVSVKLDAAGMAYRLISSSCIALANNSGLSELVVVNEEVVIQDLNSQRVGEMLMLAESSLPFAVWDCCAASGGKSIMAYDLLPDISLTVSDIRESILVNLRNRFAEAGIRNYKSFVTDLSKPVTLQQHFNLLIADVPCTGSGTWSRTPEQLFYFDEAKIADYAKLQKQIISNVLPWLKPGGYLLYITCSVFKQENEEQAAFIQNEFKLELIRMELLKGYEEKADTLFAALFRKPL